MPSGERREAQGVDWRQLAWKLTCSLQTVLSTEPDMPSYAQDLDDAEGLLQEAQQALGGEW